MSHKKLFNMKRILAIAFFGLIMLTSCQHYANEKLIGTWSLSKIDYEFDETKHTPKMIRQIAEAEAMIKYQFVDDNQVKIITNGQEANFFYSIDCDDIIYIGTTAEMERPIKLGVYADKTIRIKSDTMIGDIDVVFKREGKN